MSWVVNTSLDGHVQCVTSRGLLVAQLSVHFLGKNLGHVVIMLGEVWIVFIRGILLLRSGHVQCVTSRGLLVAQLAVHFLGKNLGHVVIMLGEVWIVFIRGIL